MAPARRWFLLESLRELQQRWQQAGSQLLLLEAILCAAAPLGSATWSRWCGLEPGCGALGRQRDRELATCAESHRCARCR